MTKPKPVTKSAALSPKSAKAAAPKKPRAPRAKKPVVPAGVLHYEPRSSINGHKLKNAMIAAGKAVRVALLAAGRRYVTLFYLDPGYINGGASFTVVDLRDPSLSFCFLWKIDLFEGEKAGKDVLAVEIVDRMREYRGRFARFFASVDVAAYEKQLERTADEYASTCSRQMGDVLAKHYETCAAGRPMFTQADAQYMHRCLTAHEPFAPERLSTAAMPRAKTAHEFDVGIVHRLYPHLYPEVEVAPPPGLNKFAAAAYAKKAAYRHNKRCSAALVSDIVVDPAKPKPVVSTAAERWLVDHDMEYHQQLRHDLTDKYDDYGDAFAPAVAFMSIVCADEHMMARRAEGAAQGKVYVFVIPGCAFLGGEPQAIVRYLDCTIIVLNHNELPFMRTLRAASNDVLCCIEGSKEEFLSWDAVKARCAAGAKAAASVSVDVLQFIDANF